MIVRRFLSNNIAPFTTHTLEKNIEKTLPKCWFGLPKSSFGMHEINTAGVTLFGVGKITTSGGSHRMLVKP